MRLQLRKRMKDTLTLAWNTCTLDGIKEFLLAAQLRKKLLMQALNLDLIFKEQVI
jgi:hypothetical protein